MKNKKIFSALADPLQAETTKHETQKIIRTGFIDQFAATMMVEEHMLKGFGYDVVTAKSGEEAVQIATGNGRNKNTELNLVCRGPM